MCLATSLAVENWDPVPVAVWPDFLWTVVYIVIIHGLICYNIYASSLRRFSVTFLTFAGLSNPLFAAVLGWFFLDEPMTISFGLAMLGVSLGLYLYYQEESKPLQTIEEGASPTPSA